jgi:methionyl-tRNA formyltransferase
MIVIHPSILPRHRGATPIQHTLLLGDTVTGNAFIEISKSFDSGNILYQTKVDIPKNSTYQTLEKILS